MAVQLPLHNYPIETNNAGWSGTMPLFLAWIAVLLSEDDTAGKYWSYHKTIALAVADIAVADNTVAK
eukprot:5511990-Ditylum_brightwellii.AAC.1